MSLNPSSMTMQETDNQDHGVSRPPFNWQAFGLYLKALKARLRLLTLLAIAFLILAVVLYFVLPARYTATALVGPPGPSPTSSMMTSLGGVAGAGAGASMLKRLVGGGGVPSANDPFQEYLQLLQSMRLVQVLIQKDHILPVLFSDRWDDRHQRWKPGGMLHQISAGIAGMTGRPARETPDADDVMKFFQKNLYITSGTKSSGSRISSLLSDNSYPEISFTFKDPRKAEQILDLILQEADNIIRADLQRDVSARLGYLRAETPKVTVTEQRDAIISVLSEQEQLQMMIQADSRFASTLIDTPYASNIPTSPSPLPIILAEALALAVLSWIVLVWLATRFPTVARRLP